VAGSQAWQDRYAAVTFAPQDIDERPRRRFFPLAEARSATMPRYFFNIMEGHSQNLVRDIEGALLSGSGEARKEALGLAQDITRHGIHEPPQTWTVIVTDENGDEVLTVPLSGAPARKTKSTFHLGGRIARLETSFGRGTILWLIGAAFLAITVPTAIATVYLARERDGYQTASAPTEGAFVAVRFASQASMEDVTKFLAAYQASLADGPRPGNMFRLRIGDTTLPPQELTKIVSRIGKEKIVEFAAAAQ
jgi:hypothetical protein